MASDQEKIEKLADLRVGDRVVCHVWRFSCLVLATDENAEGAFVLLQTHNGFRQVYREKDFPSIVWATGTWFRLRRDVPCCRCGRTE